MMLLWFRNPDSVVSTWRSVWFCCRLMQNKLLVLRHNSYINVNKRLSTTRRTTMSFRRFSELSYIYSNQTIAS